MIVFLLKGVGLPSWYSLCICGVSDKFIDCIPELKAGLVLEITVVPAEIINGIGIIPSLK